ncbi:Gp49 family protein [Clostridium sp.]|uniref:Gp49 family protein n=1 Tax=Clostridium sp. TaxID=1506 RepID=UPI0039942BC0
MRKYIRVELLEDDRQVFAATEDMRLGILSEKNLLEVKPNDKLPSGVSIGQEMVDNFIKETHISTIGGKTTLVRVVLKNGFEIIESSACVDKANYSKKIGAEICIEKIKDKIWFLLGFLLQSAVEGIN